jgi:uncharacterized protein YbjT (DUF2867 family)
LTPQSSNSREAQQKETVLVTGGSGFVGLHTISQLLGKNYKVKATIGNAAKKTK